MWNLKGIVLGMMLVVAFAERAEAQFGGSGFQISFGGGNSRVSFGAGSGFGAGPVFGGFPGYGAVGGFDPLTQQFQRVPSYGYGGGYGGGLYVDPHTGNYLAPSNFYGGGYPVYGIPTQRVFIQGGYGGYHHHRHHHHHH